MKIRDDHDSSKKRGQYQNFQKKISLIHEKFPNTHLDASMWFVDDSLEKNKNFYLDEMVNDKFENVALHLYYGGEFFANLKNGLVAWEELLHILKEYRLKHVNDDVEIPDFGKSKHIYNALLKLPTKYWNKLISDKREFILLREELFSSGDNLQKVLRKRSQ